MRDNEILMIHGTEYKEMTKQLLLEADLAERLPNKEACIGIKPNLVSATEASYGATTHPQIVAGILEYLRERDYRNVVILEGSWVGDRTEEAFEVCGYRAIAEQYQAELWDTQKDQGVNCDCNGLVLSVCSSVKKLDFLINVPVLKGHCQTKITCALKNMKGLIPNKEKRRFHSLGLHKPIAHLNSFIHQDFIVVDNICGDQDFEDGGNPVQMDRIIAAVDPVLCDAYACRMLNYEPEEVPYIMLAEKLKIGCADFSKAVLRCCNEPMHEGEMPTNHKVVEVRDAVQEVESCSACYGYLIPALWRLKEEGLLEKLDTKICIGQGYRGAEGILGIGNCTRSFAYSLKGCPPTEAEIYHFLKEYIESHKK